MPLLFLLSPAKTQRSDLSTVTISSPPPIPTLTTPVHIIEANQVAAALALLPLEKLRSLLAISAAVGEVAALRTREFATTKLLAPAAFVFDGPAYRSLDALSLPKEALHYLQNSLLIICPLYGILKPLDLIKNYRLEMTSKLHIASASDVNTKDLYTFWGDKIARGVKNASAACGGAGTIIVNVASEEYASAVLKHKSILGSTRRVNIRFPGASVYAKAARGAIVRFAALKGVTEIEQLYSFTGTAGELRFDKQVSTEDELVFIRIAAEKKKGKVVCVPVAVSATGSTSKKGSGSAKKVSKDTILKAEETHNDICVTSTSVSAAATTTTSVTLTSSLLDTTTMPSLRKRKRV